jgi:hypothetical protein
VNGDPGGAELARLIKRSAELKRDLVGFACSPRLERTLAAAMREAGLEEIEGSDAIGFLDRFALQYRGRNGRTVVDRFVASRPELDAADREILLGWRDPVEGIFEIRGEDGDALILLNLIDDLEYRTYSNIGPVAFQGLPEDGFVLARLVPVRPVPAVWLVSGTMSSYRKSDAGYLAEVAMKLATKRPGLVFRNPEKVERGWKQMRDDRAGFMEFFGSDELVLPPDEAEERLNAYYRQRQEAALARRPSARRPRSLPGVDVPAVAFPPDLAEADTVGVIFDDVDGLNFYPEYGMLRDLFGNPALATGRRYADALRGYLRSDTIAPLPLQRLAAAHPDTVDAVFRKILRQPDFTWAEHGEALMRRRKAWYYRHEPRPGVSVIGDRLMELAFGPRG